MVVNGVYMCVAVCSCGISNGVTKAQIHASFISNQCVSFPLYCAACRQATHKPGEAPGGLWSSVYFSTQHSNIQSVFQSQISPDLTSNSRNLAMCVCVTVDLFIRSPPLWFWYAAPPHEILHCENGRVSPRWARGFGPSCRADSCSTGV